MPSTPQRYTPAGIRGKRQEMKSKSRVYSVQATAEGDSIADRQQHRPQIHCNPSRPPGAACGNTTQQDSATVSLGSASLDPNTDEELTVEVSGPRIHAPWPGLHGVCDGCGTPSVSGLGSGPTECEHCHQQIAGGEGGAQGKLSGKGSSSAATAQQEKGEKDGVVAVTSCREVALGDHRAKALARVGAGMLTTSSLLLLLLLVAW